MYCWHYADPESQIYFSVPVFQITRSQHDLVKRMKQSGDGIQTKHLTGVIGDIDNFHVKPYETLMEDEKKKLHAYWSVIY